MNYLEMLEEYRNTLIRIKRVRYQLENLDVCSVSGGAACCVRTGKSRNSDRTAQLAVMRTDWERRLEALDEQKTVQKQKIMSVIRESKKPDLLKALYWRRISRLKWNDICEKLEHRHSCTSIRQAASRYIRQYQKSNDEQYLWPWNEVS